MLRDVGIVDPSTTVLGRADAAAARARPHRLHPHRRSPGRAGRRPRRGARRAAVLAVDDGHPVDRGGRRGQRRRPAVVPGVRVARPRTGEGDDRACRGGRLRGADRHRRHGDARQARARRAPRLLPAAEDRPRHPAAGRHPPRLDVAVRAVRAGALRQRRRPGRRRRRQHRGGAGRLHQHPVRPGPVVGRHRVDALRVGRPDRAQGDPDRGRRRCSPSSTASRRSPCRTTAAASSTTRRRRSASWRPVVDAVGERDRGVLRRRRAPRQRHRQGRRARCPGLHDRPRLPLRRSPPAASAASTTCSRLLDADVRRTMALVGATDVAALGRELVEPV